MGKVVLTAAYLGLVGACGDLASLIIIGCCGANDCLADGVFEFVAVAVVAACLGPLTELVEIVTAYCY